MKKLMLMTAILVMNLAWAAPVFADDLIFGRKPATVGEQSSSHTASVARDCESKHKDLPSSVAPAPKKIRSAQEG